VFISGRIHAKKPDTAEQAIVALGYSKNLSFDVHRFAKTIVLAEKRHGINEEDLRSMVTSIRKSVKADENTFDLSRVLTYRKANCLGFAQLFLVVGRSVGLDPEVIAGPVHIVNGVTIDEQFYLVDVGHELVIPISIKKEFERSGAYFVQRSPKLPYLYDNIRVGGLEILCAGLLISRAEEKKSAKPSKQELVDLYERAIAIDFQNVQAYYNLGNEYAESDPEKALGLYYKAIDMGQRKMGDVHQ